MYIYSTHRLASTYLCKVRVYGVGINTHYCELFGHVHSVSWRKGCVHVR